MGTGRAREFLRVEMAENKEKLLLTYKHLRCKPEDRMRKRGTYGLTNAINTRKIGGFLLFYVVYIYTQWVNILLCPGFQETQLLLPGKLRKLLTWTTR